MALQLRMGGGNIRMIEISSRIQVHADPLHDGQGAMIVVHG